MYVYIFTIAIAIAHVHAMGLSVLKITKLDIQINMYYIEICFVGLDP